MNRQSKVKKGVLGLVIGACLVAVIGGTYSRYVSTGTANASATIAKWAVALNGEDISSQTKNVNVTLEYDNNSYVKDGKMAPGSTAHFDVELDPTGSEVAIDYTFNVDTTLIAQALEENSTSAIAVTGATYKVGNGASQNATIDANGMITVPETLAQVEAGNKVVVTVTLAWDNASNANNASDTVEGVASFGAGVNGKTVTVPVTVTAQQHI